MSMVNRRCNEEEVTMVLDLKFVIDGDNGGEFIVCGGDEVVVGGGECYPLAVESVFAIMSEVETTNQVIEPYITRDIDTNDYVEATYESEKINSISVNIEFDEDDVNDERILGKIFDTPDDAYTFYNDYSFLHGFGIRRDDTIKNPKTNEPFRKIYVCNKEGFKRMDKNASSENEKNRHRDVRTGCQAKLRITRQEDGKWVNHHGQFILFGGALLENEKEETFEWKHETEHLRSYVSRYSDFQETHRPWVNSDTIEKFEATWEDIRIRFFNSRTMLNEFVVQYDKAVESRRADKEDEDFKTMNSRPVLSSVHLIEAKEESSQNHIIKHNQEERYDHAFALPWSPEEPEKH
uniref:FAR1 domain-containing protein n=1 Tax=Lactuca sativa TaxID=4236 RepID=A0A9R1WIT1_LACSA|nr:hypothetical protein LSAT_V11C100000940 [Lactuca sativa]